MSLSRQLTTIPRTTKTEYHGTISAIQQPSMPGNYTQERTYAAQSPAILRWSREYSPGEALRVGLPRETETENNRFKDSFTGGRDGNAGLRTPGNTTLPSIAALTSPSGARGTRKSAAIIIKRPNGTVIDVDSFKAPSAPAAS
jgi:hypothetical protein